MKHLNTILLLAILFSAITIQSCKDKEEDMPAGECPDTPLTYEAQIKEIINKSCALSGCHGDNTAPGLFTDYNGLEIYITNGMFTTRVLEQRSMPPAPNQLSSKDYNDLKCWAEGGFRKD